MSEREIIDAIMHRLHDDSSFAAHLEPEERESLLTDEDELSDAVFSDATGVLSIGWDAGTMAASGCLSINEWHGIYFITSSDQDPAGPFVSVAEALQHDYFSIPIPGLELQSDVVPLQELQALGACLLHPDETELTINDQWYVRTKDSTLIEKPA
jgi:hypothetical protein